jgi:hypothetical protein
VTEARGVDGERHTFLPALKYPQFRLLWVSGLCAWVGRWIDTVVGAWLVLELTNSPFSPWLSLRRWSTCFFFPISIR